MTREDKFYVIGVDGGASKTRGVLIDNIGNTLSYKIIEQSSNLSINPEAASNCIIDIVEYLCKNAKINIDLIDSIGLALAGSSSQDGRDIVFGKLDNFQLSHRTLIMNDAEAAYELSCPGDIGILVSVGTGIICMARSKGKVFREAGNGHEMGDLGSGYWIGKQVILNLTLNETTVMGDRDLEKIMKNFMDHTGGQEFQSAIDSLYKREDAITIIGGMAKKIINLAEKGNDIAIGIIQEATHAVAEYILNIIDKIQYEEDILLISGNGSLIKNNYFRSSVNDELKFHFSDIRWTFSTISSAYGAAIMSARIYNLNINVSDIIKRGSFVSA